VRDAFASPIPPWTSGCGAARAPIWVVAMEEGGVGLAGAGADVRAGLEQGHVEVEAREVARYRGAHTAGPDEYDVPVHPAATPMRACGRTGWPPVEGSAMLKELREFILRGNPVDPAVAVVIGTAFTAVVTSLVEDLLTPLVTAFVGDRNFSALSFTINGASSATAASSTR
jgi:hypothetical protein